MAEKQITLDDGITLLNGSVFNHSAPHECDAVTIEDIARPLSNICRFAGQMPYFYSVAQHAVNVARILPDEHKFTGLMHDTSEAFTNDIVTPLKHKVPMFKEIERLIEADMGRRFGFPYPLPEAVHVADRQMLALEMKYIRGQDPTTWEHLNGIEFEHLRKQVWLHEMTPTEAYEAFTSYYEEYRP